MKRTVILLSLILISGAVWARFDLGSLPFSVTSVDGGRATLGPPVSGGPAPFTDGLISELFTDNAANSNNYVNGIYPDASGNSLTGWVENVSYKPTVEVDASGETRLHWDATDDWVKMDWNTGAYSNLTESTNASFAFWLKVDTGSTATKAVLTLTRSTHVGSYIYMWVYMTVGVNEWLEVRNVAGTSRWRGTTPQDTLKAGDWIHIVYAHNGAEPEVYTNGALTTITYSTEIDKTQWVEEIYDRLAAEIPDKFMIGAFQANSGSPILEFDGMIDALQIFTNNIGTNAMTLFDATKGAHTNATPW